MEAQHDNQYSQEQPRKTSSPEQSDLRTLEGTGIGGTDISGEDSYAENTKAANHNSDVTTDTHDRPDYSKLEDDTDRRNNELI